MTMSGQRLTVGASIGFEGGYWPEVNVLHSIRELVDHYILWAMLRWNFRYLHPQSAQWFFHQTLLIPVRY